MDRRQFLNFCGAAGMAAMIGARRLSHAPALRTAARRQPAFSVVPVVGDGKWIWRQPPPDQTGYLEQRRYELQIGIRLEGIGQATQLAATTPVPVEYPEQKIESVDVQTEGCEARLVPLADGAAQLLLSAPHITKGQVVSAVARFKLHLFKQYFGYTRDQFPRKQIVPIGIQRAALQNSPGIQTSADAVRQLAAELSKVSSHPWEIAREFARWIPRNIRPQIGSYTSVTAAIETRRGDCEEMAGLFVALCRAVSIPARLIWVPNHAWAEFFLVDVDGRGHWIPAHTACYDWFGWTGAHELVLQKGDRVYVPQQRKQLRLLEDWMQWSGRKPRAEYTAELVPVAEEAAGDPGPGARRKDASGRWPPLGTHPLDRFTRI